MNRHALINAYPQTLGPLNCSEGKSLVDVAIVLGIDADEVLGIHSDYLRLLNLQKLLTLYREMGDEDFILLEYLYNQLKWEHLNKKRTFTG